MCLPLSAPREAKEGSKTVRLVGDKSKQCHKRQRGAGYCTPRHLRSESSPPKQFSEWGCTLLCVYGVTTKNTAKINSGKIGWRSKCTNENVAMQSKFFICNKIGFGCFHK